MKNFSYILAFIGCFLGVFTDNLAPIGGSIFVLLQLIYFELKKQNDR